MAKQLGKFELIIRGNENNATELFRRYTVEDSVDPEMSKFVDEKIDIMQIDPSTPVSTFWANEVSNAKTKEGI